MSDTHDGVRKHDEAANGDPDGLLATSTGFVDGIPGPVTAATLAGIDQFHFGDRAATAALARHVVPGPEIQVLDAGSGLGGPSRYLADKGAFRRAVVKPLQDKVEPVSVVPGSDAEAHAVVRFPHKTVRRTGSGLRPQSVAGFPMGLPLTFQRNRARAMDATYHFRFTGVGTQDATVTVRRRSLTVEDGPIGRADLVVRTDGPAWLQFVRRERGLLGLLPTRKLRLKGSPKLLVAFGKCFP